MLIGVLLVILLVFVGIVLTFKLLRALARLVVLICLFGLLAWLFLQYGGPLRQWVRQNVSVHTLDGGACDDDRPVLIDCSRLS